MTLWDVDETGARRLHDEHAERNARRHDRVRRHVEETLVSGLFDVVHVEEGSGGDGALCFPLRLQRLKPESFDSWLASWLAPFRAIGRPPEGIVRAFALRGEDDPDFAMGIAFFRGSFARFRNDHHGAIEASRKAQERVIDQIWIDAAYELVDEVVPARF